MRCYIADNGCYHANRENWDDKTQIATSHICKGSGRKAGHNLIKRWNVQMLSSAIWLCGNRTHPSIVYILFTRHLAGMVWSAFRRNRCKCFGVFDGILPENICFLDLPDLLEILEIPSIYLHAQEIRWMA